MIKKLFIIIKEYGIVWVFLRILYSIKLKTLRLLPSLDFIFESNTEVSNLDIFNFNTEELEKFYKNLPIDIKEKIINDADLAIDGTIEAFSNIRLNYGNPINWQYNPITKKETDKSLKWFYINDFDEDRGDVKIIWEISRFTHLFLLSKAYLITKNIKYYNAFSSQINNWVKDNPYSYGANWKCGQEASIRMFSVLMNYSIFRKYNIINCNDTYNVKKIIEWGYKKVLSNFFYAHRCIKNNHTFSEILGRNIGALCCNDEADLKYSIRLINEEISKQFTNNGGCLSQYSFNYQRFTFQILEIFIKLNGISSIDSKNINIINNSINLLYQCQDSIGMVPNYGSNDGSLILPFSPYGYLDYRPTLNTLFYLINSKCLYKNDLFNEEMLWICDEIHRNSLRQVEKRSISFERSGFFILRFNNGFVVVYLNNYNSRPDHFDQLHLDIWYNGLNIFCDCGTYSYATELGSMLKSTYAHNTLKVDNIEQMNKIKQFFVFNFTKRKDIKFSDDYFQGTMTSNNGYTHTRKLKIVNQNIISISDSVITSNEAKNAQFIFNTEFDVKLNKESNILNIICENNILCSINTEQFDNVIIENSFKSEYYLSKKKINKIVLIKKINDGRVNVNYDIFLNE